MFDRGHGKKDPRDFEIDIQVTRTGTMKIKAASRTEAETEAREKAASGRGLKLGEAKVEIIETREAGW